MQLQNLNLVTVARLPCHVSKKHMITNPLWFFTLSNVFVHNFHNFTSLFHCHIFQGAQILLRRTSQPQPDRQQHQPHRHRRQQQHQRLSRYRGHQHKQQQRDGPHGWAAADHWRWFGDKSRRQMDVYVDDYAECDNYQCSVVTHCHIGG